MTEPSLAALLWDMDGTIIDSEPLWIRAEMAMLARYNLSMSDEMHASLIGSGLWAAAELFRSVGVPMAADDIVTEWVESVSQGLSVHGPTWRPGARSLLASLNSAKIPCALVTMSTSAFADRVIERLPPNTFQAVITGDLVDHEKPHPQPYLLGAEALNAAIGSCLVIEDSPTGVHSGVASGAVTVGVPHMLELTDTPAHLLWPSLQNLSASDLQREFAAFRSVGSSR